MTPPLIIQHQFHDAIEAFTENVQADMESVSARIVALDTERAALLQAQSECLAKLSQLEPRVALEESAALEFSTATLRAQKIDARLAVLDGEKPKCGWRGLGNLLDAIVGHWTKQIPIVLSKHFLDAGICDNSYTAIALAKNSDAYSILQRISPRFTHSPAGIWEFLERVKLGQIHLGIDLPSPQPPADSAAHKPQPQPATP